MFCHFWQKLKIQNGRHFWGGENFFLIAKSTVLRYLWVENFDEIALSRMVKEIEANLCFAIFDKNSKKFKMAATFEKGKILLKIAKSTFLRYPVGRKFRRNRYIWHG